MCIPPASRMYQCRPDTEGLFVQFCQDSCSSVELSINASTEAQRLDTTLPHICSDYLWPEATDA